MTRPAPTEAVRSAEASARSPGGQGTAASRERLDAEALRVSVAVTSFLEGDEPLVVAPDHTAAEPQRLLRGGEPFQARLIRHDERRATLEIGEGSERLVHRVLYGTRRPPGPEGVRRLEVVVEGWRLELEIEFEQRARLRERARRGREGGSHGGPAEVRAMIPGRVVTVLVAAGDLVEAGQQLLVIEAMKMQNEVRAPIAGTVERIGAAEGRTVELGDVLVVLRP